MTTQFFKIEISINGKTYTEDATFSTEAKANEFKNDLEQTYRFAGWPYDFFRVIPITSRENERMNDAWNNRVIHIYRTRKYMTGNY